MARNKKGNGSIYRQAGEGRSKNWTLQYIDPITGQRKQVSSGTAVESEARAKLIEVLAAAQKGESVDLKKRGAHVWTFDRAAKRFDQIALNANLSSREHNQRRLRLHLEPIFQGTRLADITTDRVDEYRNARRDAGAAPATINSELAVLRRMFILAHEAGYRGPRPIITLPHVKNARQGFFEYDAFVALRDALPDYWRNMLTFAYYTGWRVTSEIAPLKWQHVDLRAGVVTIFDSKNGEGRTFPFAKFPELKACLVDADRQRKDLAKRGILVTLVFHHEGRALVSTPGAKRTSRAGTLMPWVRKAWHDACRATGVPHIPHDLRRTAVRNLIRAGVPLKTAMKLTGHKTDSVFLRYFIVDEHELGDAVARLAAASAQVAAAAAAERAATEHVAGRAS